MVESMEEAAENDETMVVEDEDDQDLLPSLIIPIQSSTKMSDEDLFVEIFPEEIPDVAYTTILQVLKDEDAHLGIWADAALLYMQLKQSRDSSVLLQTACDQPSTTSSTSEKDHRVRILASAGIALLTQQSQSSSTGGGTGSAASKRDPKDELRSLADNRFTHASKVDTFYPMTWIGRGMLNLSVGRLDQARFFFDTTLKQCGKVLPALLGMAAVMYGEKDYKRAQETYAEAMKLYPEKSGASTRVGFGLACYRLGQVDRAKAAFARALDIDRENVEAMVGAVILDMASLDETEKDFNSRAEKAIKMISMANLLDHSNAMVQNHLANHYFWKWTPVAGSVEVTQGSTLVKGSQPVPLDPGERIRIGRDFETHVVEEDKDDDTTTTFRIRDAWKNTPASGLKLWKKDYDRVVALAKGAYSSTSVQEIQAESLFFLARVYHVREDIDNAHKFYEKACKLAPSLSPARFGLAQVLIMKEKYDDASAHLKLVIGTSARATDALALLGLLQVRSGKDIQEGLKYLRKAIDLDSLNPDLVLLEALALQQHESNYPKSVLKYKKAIELMQRKGRKVPYEIYTNLGVLCHETKKFDEALEMYKLAFLALDEDGKADEVDTSDQYTEHGNIVCDDNAVFFKYVETDLKVQLLAAEDEGSDKKKFVLQDSKGKDPSSIVPVLRVGLHVRIGETFCSEVVEVVSKEEEDILIHIKDTCTIEETDAPFTLAVKRGNKRLESPPAISIAFNLARLHEAKGRTVPAIELHKAIVKRNPAYVSSYLRLACIARDCGCLNECAEWLKIAATTAPGNPEVLTLIGNLHLSLCDWAPAQNVFDGLLAKKVPDVEAYAMLSLGNIYFANIHVSPKRYAKHLQYASDYYKKILTKDPSNAYAANGLGTVLAEKGELFKAKEAFNRVREVSGDTIADALLNIGHIHLAQKKHPEALQMYNSYIKRTEDGTAPITSKSRVDDVAAVQLFIAFAYFDWARHTELFNNAKAAPADERYQKAMEHLKLAISKKSNKDIILRYDLCMTKLQAGNCILQKLTRNIRRTAKEVEDALLGLEESLGEVEILLRDKTEGKKVPIPSSTLQDFITHCKANIISAKSHLADERKREEEANTERELKILAAEAQRKEDALRVELQKEDAARKQEEKDKRASEKMRKVESLRAGWEHDAAVKKAAAEKRATKKRPDDDFIVDDDPNDPNDPDAPAKGGGLFDDSDDDSSVEPPKKEKESTPKKDSENKQTDANELFGDSDSDESDEELLATKKKKKKKIEKVTPSKDGGLSADDDSDDELLATDKSEADTSGKKIAQQDLFGDDSDDDEAERDAKRPNEDENDDDQPKKKRRVVNEDE